MSEPFAWAVGGGVATAAFVWFTLRWRGELAASRILHRRLLEIRPSAEEPPVEIVRLRGDRYSDVPPIRRLMKRFSITARLALLLEQAGSRMNVSVLLLCHAGCAALAWIITRAARMPALLEVALVAIAAVFPALLLLSQRRRRFATLLGQMPDAVRLISSALRAGLGLDTGLTMVGSELPDPIGGEFRRLLNEWRLHGDMHDALERFTDRLPLSDMKLFAAASGLHREVGGNFAEVLDQLEQTIRTRFQLQRELKTMTAESRLSGWIIGLMPLIVGIGISVLNPGYFGVLLHTDTGRIMLWIAGILELFGFMILRWLVTPRVS